MDSPFGAAKGSDLHEEPFRSESGELRAQLDACRERLAEMTGLFDVHRKANSLLDGEKTVTEMIAKGDALEAILERSCRLVEEALPGSLSIIMLLDGGRLHRGAA